MAGLLRTGMILVRYTSAPEPQPETSKKEVQQDSDRFFEKMKKEENAGPLLKNEQSFLLVDLVDKTIPEWLRLKSFCFQGLLQVLRCLTT